MDRRLQQVSEDISSFFQNLDILNIYLFSYSLAALLLFLCHLYCSFSKTFLLYLKCMFLRFLALPILFQTARFARLTRFQAFLLLVLIGFNIVPLCLGDLSVPQRAAFMALLNLVPTYLGKRAHPLVTLLGLSLPSLHLLHRWAGRLAAMHAIIHAVMELGRSSSKELMISGYLVSIPPPELAMTNHGPCTRRQQVCRPSPQPPCGSVMNTSHACPPSCTTYLGSPVWLVCCGMSSLPQTTARRSLHLWLEESGCLHLHTVQLGLYSSALALW